MNKAQAVSFVEVTTQEHISAANKISKLAKRESFFSLFNLNTNKALLLSVQDKYVGLLTWSINQEKNIPVLNSVYVMKSQRNKGYGTKAMREWVEKIALKNFDHFWVESPNEATLAILTKVGCDDKFTVVEY